LLFGCQLLAPSGLAQPTTQYDTGVKKITDSEQTTQKFLQIPMYQYRWDFPALRDRINLQIARIEQDRLQHGLYPPDLYSLLPGKIARHDQELLKRISPYTFLRPFSASAAIR
jgi:hypothetical protein